MTSSLVVLLGSGIGGALRHILNGWVMRLLGSDLPVGILAINVVGSLAMGLIAGWFALKGNAPQELRLFFTTGVLGGFTTFSAFSLDVALLYERGQPWFAVGYAFSSVALAVGGVFAGLFIVRSFS